MGVALLRGVPVQSIVDNWFGNSNDTAKGRQMPIHYSFRRQNLVSISSPIGTQILQAVGCAMGMRIRKESSLAVTYFGEVACASTDFDSALNFLQTDTAMQRWTTTASVS